MSPLDVARYLRCFQKAATTKKVKSRMIRRESRFDDNLAELIRSVLPKCYFRLVRRRRGYALMWMGTNEAAQRIRPRLAGFGRFDEVVVAAQHQRNAELWIGQPTEELLDQAVTLYPVLSRFKREEARLTDWVHGRPVEAEPVEPVVTSDEDPINGDDVFEEENEEELTVGPRVVVATEITPNTAPQHNLAAAFAEAARARTEALADQPPAFQTDGARRFAEMLARVNRGRQ